MQGTVSIIRAIQHGNKQLREDFIALKKEEVRKFASFICKRQLDWQNDDELSISLIAFNKAIDSYNITKGKNFYSYAWVLVKNSLIDYFRIEEKHRTEFNLNLINNDKIEEAQIDAAQQQYNIEQENLVRAYEILCFEELLKEFSLSFEALVENSPCHSDTRDILKKAAFIVSQNKELTRRIYQEKKLPLKEIQLLTGVNRKTLENWRRYFLSLIIILTCEEIEVLVEHIQVRESQNYEK